MVSIVIHTARLSDAFIEKVSVEKLLIVKTHQNNYLSVFFKQLVVLTKIVANTGSATKTRLNLDLKHDYFT